MDEQMHNMEPPRDPGMEAEQLRITIENMHETKPSKHFDFYANAQYPLIMKQQTINDAVLKDLFGVSGRDLQDLRAAVAGLQKGDGPELDNLVKKSRANGIDVDVVVGDAAYSGKENIQMAAEENIELVAKLNPSISQGCRKEENKFEYNKDAGMFVCPAGHMAVRKARQGKKNTGTNQTASNCYLRSDIKSKRKTPN